MGAILFAMRSIAEDITGAREEFLAEKTVTRVLLSILTTIVWDVVRGEGEGVIEESASTRVEMTRILKSVPNSLLRVVRMDRSRRRREEVALFIAEVEDGESDIDEKMERDCRRGWIDEERACLRVAFFVSTESSEDALRTEDRANDVLSIDGAREGMLWGFVGTTESKSVFSEDTSG
mmetsp:Transcript_21748/g.45321  ORF Transcript_21748/g.45321 Transcript_21748/m.45321 type:complete len:178 (+) Transcript_21748:698-1231(+)